MNRTQTFVSALVLVVAGVVLFLTGHESAGSLALGAAIGTLTPSDPRSV
jgi:hypothetical protein